MDRKKEDIQFLSLSKPPPHIPSHCVKMYKTKLQELCHQRSWSLPEYTTVKNGPDHNPRFTATALVNGLPFETPDECRSSKQAQNQVAKLALDHFTLPTPITQQSPHSPNPTAPPPPPPPPSGVLTSNTCINIEPADIGILLPTNQKNVKTSQANQFPSSSEDNKKSKELLHLYKNRLQSYAQKRNLTLPVYTSIVEGPPHARRYKSRVTVNEKTFETSDYFSTLKEAEHAAAQVAFESLPHNEVQENEGLYKTLLQELAQKKGFTLPAYDTARSGPPHMSTFASSVEVGGQVFKGQEAKTKKQAEMNAAKAAYNEFTKHMLLSGRSSPEPTDLFPGGHSKEDLGVTSFVLQSIIAAGPQPVMGQDANSVNLEEQEDKGKVNLGTAVLSSVCYGEMLKKSSFGMDSVLTDDSQRKLTSKSECIICEEKVAEVADAPVKRLRSSSASDTIYAQLRDPFPPMPSPEDGASTPTTEESTNSVLESDAEAGLNTIPKVTVYPNRADMTFSVGSTLLPFSDDKWVAIKENHNP